MMYSLKPISTDVVRIAQERKTTNLETNNGEGEYESDAINEIKRREGSGCFEGFRRGNGSNWIGVRHQLNPAARLPHPSLGIRV